MIDTNAGATGSNGVLLPSRFCVIGMPGRHNDSLILVTRISRINVLPYTTVDERSEVVAVAPCFDVGS